MSSEQSKHEEQSRNRSESDGSRELVDLADRFAYGFGVKQDSERAVALYQMASDMGNLRATVALGWRLMNGLGVAVDVNRAFQLFQNASSLGDARATYKLGQCHYYGDGVAEDKSKALELFQRAAEMGDPCAVIELAILLKSHDKKLINYKKEMELQRIITSKGLIIRLKIDIIVEEFRFDSFWSSKHYLTVNTEDTVADVKRLLLQKGVSLDDKHLTFHGLLYDDDALLDCGVLNGSTLFLLTKPPGCHSVACDNPSCTFCHSVRNSRRSL